MPWVSGLENWRSVFSQKYHIGIIGLRPQGLRAPPQENATPTCGTFVLKFGGLRAAGTVPRDRAHKDRDVVIQSLAGCAKGQKQYLEPSTQGPKRSLRSGGLVGREPPHYEALHGVAQH